MKKTIASMLMLMILLFMMQGTLVQAASSQLLVKGSWLANESGDVVVWPTIYVHGNGGGTATNLGLYTVHFDGVVNNDANGVGTAVVEATFTASDNSQIFAKGTGLGVPTSTPGINHIVENYTITGGTGRFDDVGGYLTVDRLLNLATSISSGAVEGTITLNRK